MLVFPSAKINLGLNVVRKRTDGFHEIETVMVQVPLQDALEVVVDNALARNSVEFTRSGRPVPGELEQDLCMRAIRQLQRSHELPGLRMHLHKHIPMGAGLGGGSSDGAHALVCVDRLLQLDLPSSTLHQYAAELGSDCPFFLQEGPCLATGRGEHLQTVRVDLSGRWLVLVNPGIHVPTSEVFASTVPTGAKMSFGDIVQHVPLEEWGPLLPNVMEAAVFRKWPAISTIKDQLKSAGASYASMSGSGSTVFGLFRSEPRPMTWPRGHEAWTFKL